MDVTTKQLSASNMKKTRAKVKNGLGKTFIKIQGI